METLLFFAILIAALGSGLIAGVFYIFSTTVMRAFRRLPATEGIAAMNLISVVIINPWFLGVFLGTGFISAALVVVSILKWNELASAYLLAGALSYLVGCLSVTMTFNVPLNNALAASPTDTDLWQRYLSVWTSWNHVRTAASFAAAVLFTLALAKIG